ncbi:TonB-dependent receptor domain-containing protein [Sphingobacterium sp. 2149]|uniref:TonB-dependent receptor plug domain-containing protein n=1 Tax=Sphingobacterium sp. 2149 TaxID=2817763 RepID=UPI001AE47660|nr:TonB-dependent receptor [Sphingobacterium sp. 2149]MDR6733316.1 iron complex outermembrane receptor protein [Sphingobacterium sp. 2149]
MLNRKFTLTNLALTLSIVSATAQIPDTTALGEVIINQNRLQIPFSKQSKNVQILTQEDIQRLPNRSINELLSNIPGVDIRQRGPFGSQADISVDGGSFEQTAILLNGVKITDPQSAHHNMNLPVPLEAIERIEIIRGPASRIFGINALTGAINIVTKKIKSNQISTQIYSGSSFKDNEQTSTGMYYGKGIQLGSQFLTKKTSHGLYFGHEDSNGQRYNTASNSNKLYYDGTYQPNTGNMVNANIGYINNQFGANGYYAAPSDKEAYEQVKTAFASVQSKHQLTSTFSLSPRLSNRYNEDEYWYLGRETTKGRAKHYSNVFGAELNATLEQCYGTFGIGLEGRFEHINSTSIGRHNRENYGGYLEFKTEAIEKLIINAGTYINYNSRFGWQVFPGLDLGYDITEHWKIIVNAGSSQRIPSFTDLYNNQTANIGNPNLTSENAYQIEGGIKYLSNRIVAQAGYFHRKIDDFIDWQKDDASAGTGTIIPWKPTNIGKNSIDGLNASFRYNFNDPGATTRYFTNLSYNYLHPSVILADGILSKYAIESLRHQVIVNFTINHKNWMLTTSNRFNERISYKSYFIADMRAAYQFHDLNIFADVQNIFDKRYIEAAAVPMPGRWLSGGVKYKLNY